MFTHILNDCAVITVQSASCIDMACRKELVESALWASSDHLLGSVAVIESLAIGTSEQEFILLGRSTTYCSISVSQSQFVIEMI